jgi:hypothetical protein
VEKAPAPAIAGPVPAKVPSRESDFRFDELWKAYPARNGKKVDKAKARTLFMALPDPDQVQCLRAVREYAKQCTGNTGQERLPKDPPRFFKDDWWRQWVPAEQPVRTIRPVPKPEPKVHGEPPPEEAAKILDRIRSGALGKSFPGSA